MINEVIPTQNFEIVRGKIGSILKIELENQKTLQNLDDDINIFSERVSPINNDEPLTINISLESGDFSGKTQKDSQGKTIFNIDIYTIGKGSKDSSFKLHKYIGLIRYILSHTSYKTLDLEPGFIGGSEVESFFIMDSDLKQDSNYLKMARISYSIKIFENQSMESGVDFESNKSKIRLHETDLGFIYQLNN